MGKKQDRRETLNWLLTAGSETGLRQTDLPDVANALARHWGLPEPHRVVIRTSLPASAWRMLSEGNELLKDI